MAGFIANATDWTLFSRDWQLAMDAVPPIRYFKMKEAAACRKEFRRFDSAQRDEKLRLLARVINRYAKRFIYVLFDVKAHLDAYESDKTIPKVLKSLYFWPFHTLLASACFDLWNDGIREPVEIVFDEHDFHGAETKRIYPLMRDWLRAEHPDVSTILPVEPTFRDDKDFMPLQAADLLAWCLRKSDDGNNPFEWIAAEIQNVKPSSQSQRFTKERVTAIFQKMHHMRESGILHGDVIRKYSYLFDKRKNSEPNQ